MSKWVVIMETEGTTENSTTSTENYDSLLENEDDEFSKCNYCGKILPFISDKEYYCSFKCTIKKNPINILFISTVLILGGLLLIIIPIFPVLSGFYSDDIFWTFSGMLLAIIGSIGFYVSVYAYKEKNNDLKEGIVIS